MNCPPSPRASNSIAVLVSFLPRVLDKISGTRNMVLLNQNQLISVRGRTCLLQLDTLILAFADAHDLGKFISRQAVEDELGRYKTWAGNIGALQRGPSSLDDRLNNAPDVADHVRRLLLDLSSGLARCRYYSSSRWLGTSYWSHFFPIGLFQECYQRGCNRCFDKRP